MPNTSDLIFLSQINKIPTVERYMNKASNLMPIGGNLAIEKGQAVKDSGGAAMILVNNERYGNTTNAEAHVLPATQISYADGLKVKTYINSSSNPVAKILFKGTLFGDDRAPVRRVNCSAESSIPDGQLNYPAFVITFTVLSNSQTYTRTVTNVGESKSSYTVKIFSPPGVDVRVEPTTLNFSELNQKMIYRVTFNRLASSGNNTVVQGYLVWNSDKHSVRSPIAVILS
ncbi:unnamed protein product [Fraxinus pennsylvanica]|uniref:Subtilisin-like protease fibronectin type-III domain-containing protein n=1 Tax=Fraxinus pennsylvanica TaxID=56036 RepID=A0AAD1YXZ1_9LAMI|nr:unnamed protein product [Fraxinus pennsylvanica]